MARPLELTPGDWAVLALVAESPAHGYAVARLLDPEGAVGQVWALSRPLVYRSVDKLQQLGLIEIRRTEQASAPERRVLAATRAGKRRVRAWLDRPVVHIREVRSDLMLKLLLLDRSGRDPSRLVQAQLAVVTARVDALSTQLAGAQGFERTLLRWRLESARAARRFLEDTLSAPSR